MCQDLNLNSPEELDLLIRWIGTTSVTYVISIRALTIDNPNLGMKKLSTRSDKQFGSTEMVESALKNRLSKFPKLTDGDAKKLFELSDLLSEIMCLKRNLKYRGRLSYYDTSVGVKPIVTKLLSNLPSKWITKASKFKQDRDVQFPPFYVLCDFISEA